MPRAREGPRVRISLPPAASQVRTCLSREFAFLRREAAVFRVYREAIDHGLDLAIVEGAAIAREEIVDRCTIFEVAFAHSLSPWSGLFGQSRWPRKIGKARQSRTALLAPTLASMIR